MMIGMIDLKAKWGRVTEREAIPIPALAVPYAVPMFEKVIANATPAQAQ